MNRMMSASLIAFFAVLALGSSTNGNATTIPGGYVVGISGAYNYSPSVIQTGNMQYFWWCGQAKNGSGVLTDTIQYESINLSTGATVGPETVLDEGPSGAWDSAYTCNPQVVEGTFTNPNGDQNNYTYAMYYTGTAESLNGNHNSVGVAFSNNGTTWVKYVNNPIIQYHSGDSGYGINQQVPWNSNGGSHIWLFYENSYPADGGNSGTSDFMNYVATSTDGINFGSPTAISNNGLSQVLNEGQSSSYSPDADWGNLAYDDVADVWYASFMTYLRPPSTTDSIQERGQFGVTVYSIPASGLTSGGTWSQVFTVDTNLTGYESNFLPSFNRDKYGNINVGFYPDIELFLSTSIPQPSWNATLQTRANSGGTGQWAIANAVWTHGQTTVPFNRYSNGTVHEVTTGWIDPNGGFYLEETLGGLYESPQGGFTQPIYGCLSGNEYYFASTSNTSAGGLILGIDGYISPTSGSGLVALYQCSDGSDYFVSPNSGCEGQTTNYLLGYALSPSTASNLLADAQWTSPNGTLTSSPWLEAYCCGGGSSDFTLGSSGTFDGDPYLLEIDNTSSAAEDVIYQSFTGQPASQIATSSVWLETSSTTSNALVQLQDGTNGYVCSFSVPAAVSSWTQYSCSGPVPSDGNLLFSVSNNTSSAGQWAKFDSPSLTVGYTPTATNLLANPQWSTDSPISWNEAYCCGGGPSDFTFGSSGTFDGDPYLLEIDNTSSAAEDAMYQSFTGQPAGHIATASVWFETSSTTSNALVQLQDGMNGYVCNFSVPAGVSSWTQYSCSGPVPSDGKLLFILSNNTTGAGQWAKFDSPSLTVQ